MTPKGFPLESAARTGWNIFDPDVAYPVAVLFESALDHNTAAMAAYCDRHHVSLAPHGKTTMAPALFRRQIAAGMKQAIEAHFARLSIAGRTAPAPIRAMP